MIVDNFGIQQKTQEEITSDIQNIFLKYYPDFSLSTQSPQGNIANAFILFLLDTQENNIKLFNNLNLLTAQGVFLDLIGYVKGIKRKSGSYTMQEIKITTNRALTLNGINVQSNFKISDNLNNNYLLIDTIEIQSAGTYTLTFRSEKMDAIFSAIGTITNIITNILGVESVINEVPPVSMGLIGESDPIYRQRLIDINSIITQGLDESIYSQILNLNNVSNVYIYNNRTNNIVNGIPPRTFYAIIEGGDIQDIATIFYQNISTTPLFGDELYLYTTPLNNSFEVRFDRPATVLFYLRTNIKALKDSLTSDILDLIKSKIVEKTQLKISEGITTLEIDVVITTILIENLIKNVFCYGTELSKDGSNWTNSIELDLLKEKFAIIEDNINLIEV
jgi:uncharacterized phage protein gp47/JayE